MAVLGHHSGILTRFAGWIRSKAATRRGGFYWGFPSFPVYLQKSYFSFCVYPNQFFHKFQYFMAHCMELQDFLWKQLEI
jgi:hypothetical protein